MISRKAWDRLKVGNVLKYKLEYLDGSYWVVVERLEAYGWSGLIKLQCLAGTPDQIGHILTVGRNYMFLENATLVEAE